MGVSLEPVQVPSSGAVLFYVPPHKVPRLPVDTARGPTTIASSIQPGSSLSASASTRNVSAKGLGQIPASGALLSNTGALFGLAKDVSEAFDKVPYVKAIAGAIQLLLEIAETVRDNETRAKELLDKVQIYARDIFGALLTLKEEDNDVLKLLKEDLLDVTKVLENIFDTIKQLLALNTVTRVLQRGEILARIEEYDRRLDTCITSLQVRSLIIIRTKQSKAANKDELRLTPLYNIPRFKNKLRSKPQIMFGRDKEIEELVELIVSDKSSRISILGTAGIGKTSVALFVVHDDRVCAKYAEHRIFLPCEGYTSTEQLVTDLALSLDISMVEPGTNLATAILQRLKESATLIVFDNLETLWDIPDNRSVIESFLQDISSIENCSILITLRGSQRPSGIAWTKHVPPLFPVDLESAVAIFKAISGKEDNFTAKLVKAVDCIPLAVTLLANMAAVDGETTEVLWERWSNENTSMLGSGRDRLTSLEASVELSLLSPRMKQDSSALRFISLMALLPDGLSPDTLQACETQFSVAFNVKRSISTLRQNALIYEDSNGFIRILSPIRLFITTHHPPSASDRHFLHNYFMDLASGAENAEMRNRLRAEGGNTEALLIDQLLFRQNTSIDVIANSVLHFCQYLYISGISSTRIIQQLVEQLEAEELSHEQHVANNSPKLSKMFRFSFLKRRKNSSLSDTMSFELDTKNIDVRLKLCGDCFGSWGQMLGRQRKFLQAQEKFESATIYHKKARDLDGEAYDLHNLACLLLQASSTFEEADCMLQQAYNLHRKISNEIGEAHDLMARGHISLQTAKIEDARRYFDEALGIFENLSDECGQATALNNIASTLVSCSKFSEAAKYYQRSLDFSLGTSDDWGISQSYAGLGNTFLLRSDLASARKYIQTAIETRSPFLDADHLHLLGRVDFAECRLVDAEEKLTQAHNLHQAASDTSGLADGNYFLALVHFYQGKTKMALERAVSAKSLYQELGKKMSYANATAVQGIITARLEINPIHGINLLEEALAILGALDSTLGQAFVIHHMAHLYLRKDPPDIHKAMELAEKALEMHKTVGNVQGEADYHNIIAECLLRYHQLSDALLHVDQALDLHRRIGDIGSEADDIYLQGAINLQQKRYEEAENTIKFAMGVHKQLGMRFAEARDLASLSSVMFEKNDCEYQRRYNDNFFGEENSDEELEYDIDENNDAESVLIEASDIFKKEVFAALEASQCRRLPMLWFEQY